MMKTIGYWLCGLVLSGGLSSGSAVAEPLNAEQLTIAETAELVRSQPVWCLGRSPDGSRCERLILVSAVGSSEIQMTMVSVWQESLQGRNKQRETRSFALGENGLCTDLEGVLNRWTLGVTHSPGGYFAEESDEAPLSASELDARLQAWKYSLFVANQGRLATDQFCIALSRVGTGNQNLVADARWLSGRDPQGEPAKIAFEAYSIDPGFRSSDE